MNYLLAVDMGLKTGLALYEEQSGLKWYRSHNYGSNARLKRGVYSLLKELTDLRYIVIEGGGILADIWDKEASRRNIKVIRINAERWRQKLFYPKQYKSGVAAKISAGEIARKVIEQSKDAPRPTSLRHDAAEAILIGLWGTLEIKWIKQLPSGL